MSNPCQQCNRTWLIITALLIGSWFQVWSQPPGHELVHYGPKNGLASAEIITLFQDSHHYLWIGHAAGVSKYDGYSFENLLAAGNDRLGKTFSITEDAKGYIWIGAERGLFCYANNTITHITFDKIHPVYAVTNDTTGALWIATSEGPAYFSAHAIHNARSTQHLDLLPNILPAWKKMFPLKNILKNIVIDQAGTVFFCDGYGIYRYAHGNLTTQMRGHIVPNDFVTGLIAAGKDSIYFSMALTGLHALENGRDTIVIPSSKGIGINVFRKNDQLYYYNTKGIYHFNQYTRQHIPLIQLPEAYWEWGSCLWLDQENNFWIGTHEQLLFARRNFFTKLPQPSLDGFDEIFTILQVRNGDLLAGGNHGKVFRRSVQQDSFSLWRTSFDRAESETIYEYPDGDLLFTSGYQGVGLLHKNNYRIYTVREGLRDNTNRFLLVTRRHQVYIMGDDGVSEVKKEPGGQLHFLNYKLYTGSTDYAIIKTGVERSNGQLLFGGTHGLHALVNDSLVPVAIKNATRKNYFITDLRIDAQDQAWISTAGDGILLCRFDTQGGLVLKKQFTENDGLSSMVYLRLLTDKDQVIWATDHRGITRIERMPNDQFFVVVFGQAQGYLGNDYHSVKMMQDASGLIWVATSSGLVHFHPSAAHQFIHTPSVAFTRVSLSDREKDIGLYAAAMDSLTGMPWQLSLPHHSNTLSVSFTGIHLSDAPALRYWYRLLGSDSNWIDAGHDRSITFRNLAAGKYTLQVKAAAGSNQFSELVAWPFTIQPPFWKQWWFLLLLGAVVLSIVYGLVRYREKVIKEKEAQKTALQKLQAVSFQYQLEIEQVINYFATSMSGQRNMEEMLWDVARNCIAKLGFEDCVIYLKDEARNMLVQKAAWGPKMTEFNKIIAPIEIPMGKGIVGAVAQSGMGEIIADTTIDDRYIVDDARRNAEITVPVINNGRVIGVIDSEHSQKDFYTARHMQILTTIASLLADKIDKMRAEQEVREQEIELITLNRDLATSQLTALRAQMNPHFIFNALNSVQQYILQGNVDEANKYLSKFSRLQREILHHCDQNFITLEKEIDMLQLYLELERLRFNGNFEYEVSLADDIDSNEIRIPPMILQPFVENAIWHGLMPKQEQRHVQVSFSLHTDDLLLCTIRDNGIGRAAAARLKQESGATPHQSKGLRLVYERLQILQQQYQQPFEATISDITDTTGQVMGTQVKLVLFIGHVP